MKGTIVLLFCICLSGCSWFRPNGECEGEDCDQTPVVSDSEGASTWYCYPTPDTDGWSCQDESDPSQVLSVRTTNPPQREVRESTPGTLAARPPPLSRSDPIQGATSILQKPAGFYAVQLIALQEEDKILEYARVNGLKDPLYAQIESEGGTFYVLLLGCYPDRLSAARAKEEWAVSRKLPAKPWIRELGPLQDAIRLAAR